MQPIRIAGLVLTIFACAVVLFLSSDIENGSTKELYTLFMSYFNVHTGANNSVASIYLNYRIFDTIFEALMLLVSVMAVIHFSRHDSEEVPYILHNIKEGKAKSSIGIVIPIIIMLGMYLIVDGHNMPGGGFQGGAALTSALICVYLVHPYKSINFFRYEFFEKCLFLLIAFFAIFFAVSNMYFEFPTLNPLYMFIMNLLIGLKVFFGLSIVFFRFVHYEDV